VAIVAVVIVLTFLLSSFAARNSDLWQHLAAGRVIAQEGSIPRQDPFTYTAEGTWVNHSWLSDLILYNIFRLATGADPMNPDLSVVGPLLIVLKAILIVLLAWIMMRIRRSGQSLWIAAIFTAISIIVLSRWLFLQPKIISFLFLGLTLYLLQRPEPERGIKTSWLSRPIIAIPLLFMLWVNLDEWFVLGPLTVLLFWLGELMQQFLFPIRTGSDASLPGRLGRGGLLLVVSVGACLVNPYFYHAFQIPSELWIRLTDSPLLLDEDMALRYARTPFSSEVLRSAFTTNPSTADIGYYVLAALGLVSFILNWADWRGWRTLVWLGFLMISAYQERTISFFAVVAGPVAALNLQDFAARRYGVDFRVENPWKTVSIAGRVVTLITCMLLVVVAWPGMLHAYSEDPVRTHHVSWQVEMNSSLHEAAAKMRELRQAGVMGEGNGFNYVPEIADYFAWFCPEEKTFFDRRYTLFSNVAESYVDMRAALSPGRERFQTVAEANQKEQELQRSLLKEMTKHHINHVIVAGASFGNIRTGVIRLWANPGNQPILWMVLYMDGRTAIFGGTPRGTPLAQNRFASWGYRPEPLAFGPNIPASDRAPLEAPRPEDVPTFLQQIWKGPVPYSIQTDASDMLVTYSRSLRGQSRNYTLTNIALWQIASLAGPVGTAALGNYAGQCGQSIRFAGLTSIYPPYLLDFDWRMSPSAAALLAVRAGRRAVKENPLDYRAYLELATAIQFLADVDERSGGRLGQVRQIQQVAALRKALALKPDSIDVHQALSSAYLQMSQNEIGGRPIPPPFDLAIEHLNRILEIRTVEGPKGRQTDDEFKKEIEQLKLLVKNRKEQTSLERRQTNYESEKRRQTSAFGKAFIAIQHGLYQEALKELIDSEGLIDRGTEGDRLALQLLIWTGQLDQARSELSGPSDQSTTSSDSKITDPQMDFWIAAGAGDYARADEALGMVIQRIENGGSNQLMRAILETTWTRNLGPDGPMGMGPQLLRALLASGSFLKDLADHWVMRGVLALEAGDAVKAKDYFERGLRLVRTPVFETAYVGLYGIRTPLEATAFLVGRSSLPEPRASFPLQGTAYRYLSLMQSAKDQVAKKTP
jgi:tetratricopeptide (TPR) repeat protein